MNKLTLLLLIIALFPGVLMAQAQKATLKGKITNLETGKVMENANIVLQPSDKGAVSGKDGFYSIENIEPGKYTLKVSFVGFKTSTKRINITEAKLYEVNLGLIATNYELSEVLIKDYSLKSSPYVKTEVKKIELEILPTRDIGDYLRQVPNISAIRKGGTQLDPVIRGFKYDQLNIRVDGFIRIEGGCPNRMDPNVSHIEVDDIEKIEVIKGPYVLRFGPNIGGFLNLVTTKPTPFPTKKFQITARAIKGYESNWNGNKERINIKAGNDRIYFNLSGNSQDYGNYKDGNGNVVFSAFKKYSFTTEAGFIPIKNHELYLSMISSYGRNVYFPALPMNERLDDTRVLSGQYTILKPFKNVNMMRISAFNSNVHHVMDTKEKPSSDSMVGVSTVDAIVTGANISFAMKPGKEASMFFVTGVENTNKAGIRKKTMYMQPAEPIIPIKTEFLIDGEITNIYAALEYEKKFKTLTLTASGRYDHNIASSGPIYIYSLTSMKPVDSTIVDNAVLNNVSISFGLNKYITEKLSIGWAIGRGVRSPNLLERYITLLPVGYDKYDYLGNPGLKAEANHQTDLNIRYETEKIGRFTGNIFVAYVLNYIAAKEVPPTQYLPNTKGVLGVKQFYNADPVFFRGFEITYASPNQYNFGGSLTAAMTRATMTKAWNKMTLIENDPLYEIPPLEIRSNVYYRFLNNRFVPRLSLRYSAEQNYVSTAYNEKTTPSFFVADLSAAFIANHIVTISGGVNNIFDTPYYEHLNRRIIETSANLYEPGRVFYLNLIVKL